MHPFAYISHLAPCTATTTQHGYFRHLRHCIDLARRSILGRILANGTATSAFHPLRSNVLWYGLVSNPLSMPDVVAAPFRPMEFDLRTIADAIHTTQLGAPCAQSATHNHTTTKFAPSFLLSVVKLASTYTNQRPTPDLSSFPALLHGLLLLLLPLLLPTSRPLSGRRSILTFVRLFPMLIR